MDPIPQPPPQPQDRLPVKIARLARPEEFSSVHDQNLVGEERLEGKKKTPEFFKLLAIDFFSVVSAAFFGYASYRYLTDGFSLWTLLILAAIFGVCSALQVFLSVSWQRRSVVVLLEVSSLFAFFYYEGWSIIAFAGITVLLFLLWGNASGSTELENSINIPFFRVSGDVLKKFTTAILLFLILIYTPQISINGISLSQESFKNFFNGAARIVNVFFPSIVLNGSYLDFAKSIATIELSNDPKFQALDEQTKAGFVNQETTVVMNGFSRFTAAAHPGDNAPASDVLYAIVADTMNSWWHSQPTEWFIFEWVIVFFVILRTLGIVFAWLVQFLTLVVYQALLAIKFMEISEKTQTKEILVLDVQ